MAMDDASPGSVEAPSPTIRLTPPHSSSRPTASSWRHQDRTAAAADGRLNPFHAGVVPPPARPDYRPTIFRAVHPHVQRMLTRHVHELLVAMFGVQGDAELVSAYLGQSVIQQRLGAFFGDPGTSTSFARGHPAVLSQARSTWHGPLTTVRCMCPPPNVQRWMRCSSHARCLRTQLCSGGGASDESKRGPSRRPGDGAATAAVMITATQTGPLLRLRRPPPPAPTGAGAVLPTSSGRCDCCTMS